MIFFNIFDTMFSVIIMKRKYLIMICLFLFMLLLYMYVFNYVSFLDDGIYNFIISIKSDIVTRFMKGVTFFASTYYIIFIMIILFIFGIIKNKKINILNLLIILNTILNRSVKIIVRRKRPILINLVEESSYSFPSGHTMVAVTLYGFLIYIIYKSKINIRLKYLFIVLLIILITLIVISRIYLGVHYFSDCLAGIFLSLAYLLFSIDLLERKNLI